ncbi:MAG: sulfite exporter TauE/SafE family protein [Candidatus Stahlbacteria bacterium]|nr:MAG: sulfite exporter TauE/SafE family protein [Candidatus Stahlbacteria bacterium]
MVMSLGLFFIIVVLAFACEFIDASVGMGYGTIGAPVLIVMGFDPLFVIPAILLSQAVGGLTASLFHQRNRNVSFSSRSKDLKIFLVIAGAGTLATIFAAIVALNIPKVWLKTYIGVLVLGMGVLMLINLRFNFSLKKMIGVGIISGFNKALSGGGFGPVVTGGQIISGHKAKRAIGVTTFAEAPICITGFITYIVVKLIKQDPTPLLSRPVGDIASSIFSTSILRWDLIVALLIGVIFVAPLGPLLTKKIIKIKWHYILGPLIILLGAWVLIKTYLL